MRRLLLVFVTALFASILVVPHAVAGNPHFVGDASIVRDGDALVVSGKLAGLGNELQVDIRVTALAECINPGTKKPRAANKESFSAEGQFPVQNGKANYSLTLVATTISPNCSPPMTIRWSNVLIEDLTHNISQFYAGPF
ncbi:MAG TPA: hypothetical protein VFZ63_01595 [Jiangellaceae bacterium]